MSYTIKELKTLCSDNLELVEFINKMVKQYKKDGIELNFYKNYGWKFDVEFDMFDEDIEWSEECAMICNEDFIDDDEDGWDRYTLNREFLKYVECTYWDKITVNNGDILLLVDEPLFSYFQLFSLSNLEDGKLA